MNKLRILFIEWKNALHKNQIITLRNKENNEIIFASDILRQLL